jgi:hypothetical protein
VRSVWLSNRSCGEEGSPNGMGIVPSTPQWGMVSDDGEANVKTTVNGPGGPGSSQVR